MGDGIRKKTSFKLYYKYGNVESFVMDQTDSERNRLEQVIANFIATGDHCYLDTPVCTIRYTNTSRYSRDKTSYIKDINFNNLVAVIIEDNDFDNYNDIGGTCNLGNGNYGVDYNCLINWSFPNVSENYLHKNDHERFMGAWSHSQNPGDDISSLFAAWREHKKNPTDIQNVKWTVRSECFPSITTLYLLNFNIIHSIEALYYYDYTKYSIDHLVDPFPENNK